MPDFNTKKQRGGPRDRLFHLLFKLLMYQSAGIVQGLVIAVPRALSFSFLRSPPGIPDLYWGDSRRSRDRINTARSFSGI